MVYAFVLFAVLRIYKLTRDSELLKELQIRSSYLSRGARSFSQSFPSRDVLRLLPVFLPCSYCGSCSRREGNLSCERRTNRSKVRQRSRERFNVSTLIPLAQNRNPRSGGRTDGNGEGKEVERV